MKISERIAKRDMTKMIKSFVNKRLLQSTAAIISASRLFRK